MKWRVKQFKGIHEEIMEQIPKWANDHKLQPGQISIISQTHHGVGIRRVAVMYYGDHDLE